jgi:hypothetical protein
MATTHNEVDDSKEEKSDDDDSTEKEYDAQGYLHRISAGIKSPANFGKLSQWKNHRNLFHHRSPHRTSGRLHVGLYSRAMGQFIKDLQITLDFDKSTRDFIVDLCSVMSFAYDSKQEKQESFLESFNCYYEPFLCEPLKGKLRSDGTIFSHVNQHDVMLFNLGLKTENGLSGSNSSMENLACFVKHWETMKNAKLSRRARAFLISIDGCVLQVHGAVLVGDAVHVDPKSYKSNNCWKIIIKNKSSFHVSLSSAPRPSFDVMLQ